MVLWVNLEVIVVNDSGVVVAEDICRNIHPHDWIDKNQFDYEDVGVVILESLIHFEVGPTQRFYLQRWPLRNVTIDGVSMRELKRLYTPNYKELQ